MELPGGAGRVFGDFCLDAYWLMHADESELSQETGLPVRRVFRQEYSLGGAGNVAANLAALGIDEIHAVSLIDDDLYGCLMLKMPAGYRFGVIESPGPPHRSWCSRSGLMGPVALRFIQMLKLASQGRE